MTSVVTTFAAASAYCLSTFAADEKLTSEIGDIDSIEVNDENVANCA